MTPSGLQRWGDVAAAAEALQWMDTGSLGKTTLPAVKRRGSDLAAIDAETVRLRYSHLSRMRRDG